jgi:hypothetical protein
MSAQLASFISIHARLRQVISRAADRYFAVKVTATSTFIHIAHVLDAGPGAARAGCLLNVVGAGVVALVYGEVAAQLLVADGAGEAPSPRTVQYRQRGNLEPVPSTSSKDSSRS